MILALYDDPILFSGLEEYDTYVSDHPELRVPNILLFRDLRVSYSSLEELDIINFGSVSDDYEALCHEMEIYNAELL